MHCRPLSPWIPAALAGVLTATAGANVPLAGQDPGHGAVVSVIEDFHAALAEGDSIRAPAHLSDDVLILESGGVEDRSHYRSGHLTGDPADSARFGEVRGRARPE